MTSGNARELWQELASRTESRGLQRDPHGKDAHEPGVKLDGGKMLAGVLDSFAHALAAVAEVGTYGARKYTRDGWQSVLDAVTRYTDAALRHRLARMQGEERDPESGLLHEAHELWNHIAVLELKLRQRKEPR